jgi:DNA repair exonuclease SbcCD ATPase subunit
MKLKKINIKEFGIVKDFSLEPGKLTVIHGSNESGKTTILDALLDALFGIRSRREKEQFEGLERYDQNVKFSGTVEVEDSGKTLIFPGEVRLDKAAGISNFRYIRNLLIVRESDLEPQETTAEKWWSELKDKLSGFEHGLTGIAENIRDEVGLTPDGKWMNRAGRRLQEEIEKLKSVNDRLQELTEEVEELSRIKSRRERLRREEEEKEKKRLALKEARERERYQYSLAALTKLKETRERLKPLSTLDPTALQQWRKNLIEIGTTKESIRNCESQKKILLSRIAEKEEEIRNLRETASTWEKREVEVIPAIEEKIREIHKLSEQEQKISRYLPLSFAGGVILAAAAVFLLLLAAFRGAGFAVAAIFPTAASISLIMLYLKWRRFSTIIAKEKTRLASTFKNLTEEISSAEEMESWIISGRKKSEQAKGAAAAKTSEIEKDKELLKQIGATLQQAEEKITSLSKQIDKLKEETGCVTLNELEAKLKERNEDILPTLSRAKDTLSQLLSTSDENAWETKIAELKRYESAEGQSDEKALERLERELEKSRDERERLLEKERETDKKLIAVGCDTPEDAWDKILEVQEKLLAFERDQKAAKLAVGIIEELTQEQESLINSVLESGENSASRYFHLITGGRYNAASYQNGEIYVRTSAGQRFSFDQLSSGARAQLLFSIRVALLERLFADRPLFLLLDDPFISSDRSRLERLLEMLFYLSEAGWQVIYFTVDKDVPQIVQNIASKVGMPAGADGLALKELPQSEIE